MSASPAQASPTALDAVAAQRRSGYDPIETADVASIPWHGRVAPDNLEWLERFIESTFAAIPRERVRAVALAVFSHRPTPVSSGDPDDPNTLAGRLGVTRSTIHTWKRHALSWESLAQKPPTRSRTFLALLRDASDEHVDAIAASMEVTPDFLVDASDHGSVLPLAARQEPVRRARRVRLTREIETGEALASFDAPPNLRRAASRDKPYEPDDTTFRDVVEGSMLSDEEKRFWLELG